MPEETELSVGPSAIEAYSRLNYTMWYALAEFIDNSTQSVENYPDLMQEVFKTEGSPLRVTINYERLNKLITIEDNSIGMTKDDLIQALRIANPTRDSRGRSKYGMGMKTAACWIAKKWSVVTTELYSGEEWTATVDVAKIARENGRVPLTMRQVSRDQHGTKLILSDLNRIIQRRTEQTITDFLGSMYQFDINEGKLLLEYRGNAIPAPEESDWDTDPDGKPMVQTFETTIRGKTIRGSFGVLRYGKGSRKKGGFSLFQNGRQIQGYPDAWKPKSIYGGEDDEGANNLVVQRLTGVIQLDGFDVSHTKDRVLYTDDEEEQLEEFLVKVTDDYKKYAMARRGPAKGQPWSREKIQDVFDSMKKEFTSPEMRDAINSSVLPPLGTILENDKKRVASLEETEKVAEFDVLDNLKLICSLQEKSEFEPYLTIAAGADPGTLHVIINGLHPYYSSLESSAAVEECLRQYVYDALAGYRSGKQRSPVTPESMIRTKNDLLRARLVQVQNAIAAVTDKETRALEPEPANME